MLFEMRTRPLSPVQVIAYVVLLSDLLASKESRSSLLRIARKARSTGTVPWEGSRRAGLGIGGTGGRKLLPEQAVPALGRE